MTTRKLPQEFFENRREQAKIRLALEEAIPENVYYHNLIIALADMLRRYTELMLKDELMGQSND